MLNFNDSQGHDKEKEFFPIEETGAKKPVTGKKADESESTDLLDLYEIIDLINQNKFYYISDLSDEEINIIKELGHFLTLNDVMYSSSEISEEDRDINRNYMNLAKDMLL